MIVQDPFRSYEQCFDPSRFLTRPLQSQTAFYIPSKASLHPSNETSHSKSRTRTLDPFSNPSRHYLVQPSAKLGRARRGLRRHRTETRHLQHPQLMLRPKGRGADEPELGLRMGACKAHMGGSRRGISGHANITSLAAFRFQQEHLGA